MAATVRARHREAHAPAGWQTGRATLGSEANSRVCPLPASTLPVLLTIAHARTLPPIDFGLSFTGVIEWLRSCADPTEFRGMPIAA